MGGGGKRGKKGGKRGGSLPAASLPTPSLAFPIILRGAAAQGPLLSARHLECYFGLKCAGVELLSEASRAAPPMEKSSRNSFIPWIPQPESRLGTNGLRLPKIRPPSHSPAYSITTSPAGPTWGSFASSLHSTGTRFSPPWARRRSKWAGAMGRGHSCPSAEERPEARAQEEKGGGSGLCVLKTSGCQYRMSVRRGKCGDGTTRHVTAGRKEALPPPPPPASARSPVTPPGPASCPTCPQREGREKCQLPPLMLYRRALAIPESMSTGYFPQA